MRSGQEPIRLEYSTGTDEETIAQLVQRKVWSVPTIDHNQYYLENADSVYKFPSGAKENLANLH